MFHPSCQTRITASRPLRRFHQRWLHQNASTSSVCTLLYLEKPLADFASEPTLWMLKYLHWLCICCACSSWLLFLMSRLMQHQLCWHLPAMHRWAWRALSVRPSPAPAWQHLEWHMAHCLLLFSPRSRDVCSPPAVHWSRGQGKWNLREMKNSRPIKVAWSTCGVNVTYHLSVNRNMYPGKTFAVVHVSRLLRRRSFAIAFWHYGREAILIT